MAVFEWDALISAPNNAVHTLSHSMPTFSFLQLLTFAILGVITTITFSILYRLTLHPLHRFPGPKLWASTRLMWVFYSFRGDLVIRLKDLHDKYGPVVRIAPDELSFIDSAAWTDIYSGHGAAQLPRDVYIFPPEIPEMPGGIIYADATHHARMRRHIAHAFSQRALEEQAPRIEFHIDVLIRQLRSLATKGAESINIADWLTFTTFDIITSLSYGPSASSIACLPSSTYSTYADFLLDAFKGGFLASTLNRYGLLRFAMHLIPRDMALKRNGFINMSIALTDKRLSETREEEHADFFTYMLKADKEDRTMTNSEMVVNSTTFVIAGSESTATLLTGMLLYLMKDQAGCMARLTDEIRSAFQSEDEITIANVSKLPYVLACLEEGLRMVTPAPFGMARRTRGPTTVAGVVVPKGTSVSVGQYAAWHSERNFARAGEFIPERWLEGQADGFGKDDKAGFHPFSVGSRNCIGKNLAHVEMRLILARLLWNFDFELIDRDFEWTRQKAFIVWEKEPLMVKIRSVR